MKDRIPITIHDDIVRPLSHPLHYTVKATSNGKKDKSGKVGVSTWHIYISGTVPQEADECYAVPPATLFYGDEFTLYTSFLENDDDAPSNMKPCAFLDKDKVRKLVKK